MSFSQSSAKGDESVIKLSAVLDKHREELESLQGVTGTGVGLSSSGDPERIVITIFVDAKWREEELKDEVAKILGSNPFEIFYMPIPDAG